MATMASADSGNRIRDQEAIRRRGATRAAQEIGPLPNVVDPERRKRCCGSLRLFCETYFPKVFRLAWSSNHVLALDKLQRAIVAGELFALAMPRSSGKTSILRVASLWSILSGRKKFVIYLAANSSKAEEALETLKAYVQSNDMLYQDFGPELHGFWRADGESRACPGQRLNGEKTKINLSADRIVFPNIVTGSADGARVSAFGIESGNLLGSSQPMPDGSNARPDFVIIDDPQTSESARSMSQTETRFQVVNADVLGMAAPDLSLSAIVLCTVKQQGDLAHRLLDRKQSPEWHGEKMALMDSMPDRMDLWDRYAEIKHDCERRDESTQPATDFYLEHLEEMNAGSKPTWPERFDKTQVSAVQYAMDLYYRNQHAFRSEYQNDPLAREVSPTMRLTTNEICERINGTDRSEVPVEGSTLTAFIDISQACLWWSVCWFDQDFNGGVSDYGVFPEQNRSYFTLSDVESGGKTLQSEYKNAAGLDGQLYGGLEDLTKDLLGREWSRRDGTKMRIERCLIDANWGLSTKIVKRFCRQSQFSSILVPSHGRYVGATSTPFDEYHRKPGEKVGQGWRMPKPEDPRDPRHIAWDTNFYKSFFHARMSTAMGDPGGFTLFGKKETASTHRMFADHCAAEFSVRVSAKGKEVDEWQEKPGQDNHWFDCVVGCMVAASERGAMLKSAGEAKKEKKPRTSLSELRAAAARDK